jgi:Neutral/alkaline non-lysosomal ceramidase, N-terminal
MKRISTSSVLVLIASFLIISDLSAKEKGPTSQPAYTWKAGIARVDITPEKMIWMAGYAGRKKPAEETIQKLYAKALLIEDAEGTQHIFITMDLIGVPRTLRELIEHEAKKRYGLNPGNITINASHTHCGPEIRKKAEILYIPQEYIPSTQEYRKVLETKLIDLIGEAIAQIKPVFISYTHGRAGFAMNRRTPTEKGFINHPYPDGPVDHDVPVLKITSTKGALKAVLFGYACHNTTMGFYKFMGDYAGYAQQYIEEAHPGVTALFFMGCGGDQNPYPRRKFEQTLQHGRALANAVETSLQAKETPIHGPLKSAIKVVPLYLEKAPSKQKLVKLSQSKNRFTRRRGTYLLDQLNSTGRISNEYPYLIQAVQFGNDLTMVILAGEVVIDYAIRFKQEINSPRVWVAGYSNDVFGYIPSLKVLKEGGYEGRRAMDYSLLPGPFQESVESIIVKETHQLVNQLKSEVK